MSFFKKLLTATVVGGLSFCSTLFADNVKIAFIEPLSGPYAASGSQGLAQFKFVAEDQVNKKGGVLGGKKFEIIGSAHNHSEIRIKELQKVNKIFLSSLFNDLISSEKSLISWKSL